MIAALLRSLVKGFNIKKRIKIERSNEECLPRPTSMAKSYILKIYGTYFSIWLMMWLQTYTQRTRRVICAYFFRKREKRRVLFLYNETLKRRMGLLRLTSPKGAPFGGILKFNIADTWRRIWIAKRVLVDWRKTTMFFKLWPSSTRRSSVGWSGSRRRGGNVWCVGLILDTRRITLACFCSSVRK